MYMYSVTIIVTDIFIQQVRQVRSGFIDLFTPAGHYAAPAWVGTYAPTYISKHTHWLDPGAPLTEIPVRTVSIQ